MERIEVKNLVNKTFTISGDLTSNYFVFDCAKLGEDISIDVLDNIRADILIINIKKTANITLDLKELSNVHLAILAKEEIKDINIEANLANNAEIHSYLADFIEGQNKTNVFLL